MPDINLIGYAITVADKYGIPESIFLNQINQESGFNQYNSQGGILTSSAGALGVAQILPSTAASPGYGVSSVDPTDPYASIDFMGQYDAAMYKRTGSITGMLEGYNAGLGNLSGGAPYASAIQNSSFASGLGNVGGVSSGSSPTAPQTGNLIQNWLVGPFNDWWNNLVGGASAIQSTVTGQTVNGVTPQQGSAAIGQTAGAVTGVAKTLFSNAVGGPIIIGVLGLVLILGALFWLANSGKASEYIQAAKTGGAMA